MKGNQGPGVYFTFNKQEALNIAKHKAGNSEAVVLECKAKVDYGKFSPKDDVLTQIKKIKEWNSFIHNTAKQGIHGSWAGNEDFREVCVKDPTKIEVLRLIKE